MTTENKEKNMTSSVITYFEKADSGDLSLLDLLTDDVQFFFPKFGIKRGKDSIKDFGKILDSFLKSIDHNIDNFNFIIKNRYVIVEGSESGVTHNNISWPDGNISQGLFCNVFEFDRECELIQRIHIYVDPDYTSNDAKRISTFYRE